MGGQPDHSEALSVEEQWAESAYKTASTQAIRKYWQGYIDGIRTVRHIVYGYPTDLPDDGNRPTP